jgi:Protein of unknown function (DUF2934)
MDDTEEKIRTRAYEIWERAGRIGNPEDHWLEAERELGAPIPAEGRPEAVVAEAAPVEVVRASEAADPLSENKRRLRKSVKS